MNDIPSDGGSNAAVASVGDGPLGGAAGSIGGVGDLGFRGPTAEVAA